MPSTSNDEQSIVVDIEIDRDLAESTRFLVVELLVDQEKCVVHGRSTQCDA